MNKFEAKIKKLRKSRDDEHKKETISREQYILSSKILSHAVDTKVQYEDVIKKALTDKEIGEKMRSILKDCQHEWRQSTGSKKRIENIQNRLSKLSDMQASLAKRLKEDTKQSS